MVIQTRERTVQKTLERINELKPDNAIFLPLLNEAVKIGDFYYIGRNGWYSFDCSGDPIRNRLIYKDTLNDNRNIGFDKIEQIQPWDLSVLHAQQIRTMIADTLSKDPEARFVIMTHTAPHREMLPKSLNYLLTNPFYVNCHMEQIIKDYGNRIEFWQHGHTHFRSEKIIDGVRIIANPRGYPMENANWEPVGI